jgi:hypothetical protein
MEWVVAVNDFRLNLKFPLWIVISYTIWLLLGILNIIFWVINNDNKTTNEMIFVNIYHVIFPMIGLYFIIQTNLRNKYYYIINHDGIYNNQVNTWKKDIKWDSELYYIITNNFFDLYSVKKMLPLEGKVINKKNKIHGYISIKTKKSLKMIIDNKGCICIPTKLLKNNIQIGDVVNMINKSRGINE